MRVILFLASMAAASCSGLSDPTTARKVLIVTDRSEYHPGNQATILFTNTSTDRVPYNRCIGSLDRRAGLRWAALRWAADTLACNDILEYLEPAASSTSVLPISASLAPGVYRYRFTAVFGPDEVLLAERDRMSNPFTVR